MIVTWSPVVAISASAAVEALRPGQMDTSARRAPSVRSQAWRQTVVAPAWPS